jgi:hypothetical protein
MKSNRHSIGYCTNVHAGPTLAATRENLLQYSVPVKQTVSPQEPLGIGLWLAAPAVEELLAQGPALFADWLAEQGLVPFTFNGFPYGNFHDTVVKHKVYEPTWWMPARLTYTQQLIAAQHALLPAGLTGSISTLPIAWGTPAPTHEQLQQAACNLKIIALQLLELHEQTGREIILSIEPEPGCYLQRSGDLVRFFREYLHVEENVAVRNYVGICHDICHAAVMFEPQVEVLQLFARHGIKIGKVQVSCAVEANFREMPSEHHAAMLAQLAAFREPRYLHQTCVQSGNETTYYEDLPQLFTSQVATKNACWRTHFHVPIYLQKFGYLAATQTEIHACLSELLRTQGCQHWEVETYAWGVLPADLQVPELAQGIAEEMRWFMQQLTAQSLLYNSVV